MTIYENAFPTDNSTAVPGFTVVTTAGSGQGSGFAVASGRLITNNTATNLAIANIAPTGTDQFAQILFAANLGASTSVGVNLAGSTAANYSGYQARHTGTDLAIQKVVSGTSTALGNVAHTRTAGMVMLITRVGNVLTAYSKTSPTDPNPVSILQVTDTGTVLTGGTTFIRSGTTNAVSLDQFAGGDMSSMGAITGGTSSPGGPVIETIPAPNPDLIPRWRGLRFDRTGKLVVPGEQLHRTRYDFVGAAGTYTPPAGLTVTGTGTAVLAAPGPSIGYLELTTPATAGASVGLASAYPLGTTQHGAILLEAAGVAFGAADPVADFRLNLIGSDAGAGIGGGAVHLSGGDWTFLTSDAGELKRTRTATTVLGPDAARRRPVGLLMVPSTQELFLMKRDKVVGYRDCAGTWFDGQIIPAIGITAQSAAAASLRLTSLTITTYA